MSKNLVKKVAVASLAALISVPNIVGSTNTYAAYNQEYESYNGLANIVSGVPQGNYTLVTDEYGEQGLVHTSQWNEYQLMLNQGSPKVICTWVKGYTSGSKSYYGIIAYQLAGQQKVTLPENAVIKVTDNYNLDHLSILKYLGNQLGSSYLFNVNDSIKKEEEKIKLEKAQIASEYVKQQAQAIADQQQIDLNNQINAELNTKSENKAGQKTALKYSSDYIKNYRNTQAEIAHQKVWASFDNERNYIQQWLDSHGFKSMQELKNYAYKTGVTHYGLQEQVAIQYCKYAEEGKCSTIGDYIRLKFKENPMAMWNQLAKWVDNYLSIDFDLESINRSTKYIPYIDIYRINLEVCKMIEADMPIIANYSHLTKEQKTSMIDTLLSSGTLLNGTATGNLSKEHVSNFETSGELRQKMVNKWNTEYLPNIKE